MLSNKSTVQNTSKVTLLLLEIFLIFLIIIPAGCSNLSRVSLLESESLETEKDIPISARYIPASQLGRILDETMGPDSEILFTSDEGKETFVVFDPNEAKPIRMAQVRRIASPKGFVIAFLGLSTEHNPDLITNVYSFEFGKSLPGLGLYSLGKDKFLKQFQGRMVHNGFGKIDGITGATPIWRPVEDIIREMAKNLIELKDDSEFLDYIQNNGKLWQRHLTLEKNIYADINPEQTSAADFEGDWLLRQWQLVAVAEISLLIAGLFIVILAKLKELKK